MKQFKKVCIVGVGLIGGSLALALKKAGIARTIVGVGHRNLSLKKAIELGAIDKGFLEFRKGISRADLVVLATPVATILKYLERDFSSLEEGALITDTGSTKKEIVKRAELSLPPSLCFVGGHPIAGSEKRGVEAAAANLFKEKIVVLARTSRTKQRALQMIKELWESVGAKPEILSPEQHDRIVAYFSHLPHLTAVALVKTVKESLRGGNLSFAGSGFKDTTRIAAGAPHLWRDIFSANADEILSALLNFKKSLNAIEKLIKRKDWEELKNQLQGVKHFREQI
ncbi:MAG: prephenate dehydrogenase [Candidatus Omnitrophica bacterium]|nr:prephenate dehydrogenase [Candidatus Omnitrophota bacterium]